MNDLSRSHIDVALQLLESVGMPTVVAAEEALRAGRVARLDLATSPPTSVIVKVSDLQSTGDHAEGSSWALHTEWAALTVLADLDLHCSPRVLAADLDEGVLLMSDLGDGPSLATLLLGDDADAAATAATRSAASLGAMHAATIGHEESFLGVRRRAPTDFDAGRQRVILRGMPIDDRVGELPVLLVAHDLPGLSAAARRELVEVVHTLAEPGAFCALTHGDPCPDNERIGPSGSQFFDFEAAAFRHALADAAHYRIPFPNCWCWRALPPDVAASMETGYRAALAAACPMVLDDTAYDMAMTHLLAAWTVWTLFRRVDAAADDLVARQRVTSALQGLAWARAGEEATPNLVRWAIATRDVLTTRWPDVAVEPPTYPAFGGPPFDEVD